MVSRRFFPFVTLHLSTVCVFAVVPAVFVTWLFVPRFFVGVMSPTEQVSGNIVVIDAGHGGRDPGAVGASGVIEKTVVLHIARALQPLLHRVAVYTVMIRDGDYDLSSEQSRGTKKQRDLTERVRRANEAKADVYISLHANSISSPRWSGAQTFYYPGKEDGRRLAEAIQARFQKTFPDNKRQARPGEYFVLKQTNMAAAVVEVGFLSNPEEERRLADPSYQKVLAEVIYQGIIDYFTDVNVE